MKTKKQTLQQEYALRLKTKAPKVEKDKKTYSRKNKHKVKNDE